MSDKLDIENGGDLTVTARQRWDLAGFESTDLKGIENALSQYFEPFAVTTVPKQSGLSGAMLVSQMIWFKRPAIIEKPKLKVVD